MMADRSRADSGVPGPGTIYLETFGCQMNVLDSQLVRGQLEGLGYRFIDDWKRADVVLYNTCSIREHAEQKVWSRVGQVAVHKRKHPDVILGVIGCMAERGGVQMARRYPQIDLLCGPGELDKLPVLIHNTVTTAPLARGGMGGVQAALQGNTHRRSQTLGAAEDRLELIDLARRFSAHDGAAGAASAYVRITRGCNKFCTYCVVPYTRGREIHRPPQHIVDECKRLVESGVREITLLGQTVNHYHYDHSAVVQIGGIDQPQIGRVIGPNNGTGGPSPKFGADITSFADLMARIHDEVPDLPRLRFVTSLPRDFGNDILQVMAERPRICRYLHLPVQTGSDRLLRLMNRGYCVEEYLDLVDRVHECLPEAELATDLICGFPTETEEDHQASIRLLRRCCFKNAFIFKYSARSGTTAHDRFEDDVPEQTKRRRNNELLAVQSRISAEVHARYVGHTVRVFVEHLSVKARKTAGGGFGANVTLGWERPIEPTMSRRSVQRPPQKPAPNPVNQLTGRTDSDLIVCFDGPSSLVGEFVDVAVVRSAPLVLFARLIGTGRGLRRRAESGSLPRRSAAGASLGADWANDPEPSAY